MHLDRLTAMEYLLVHRGQRGQSYEYELLHDAPADSDAAHLAGLIEVDALKPAPTMQSSPTLDPQFAGVNDEMAAPSRPQRLRNAGASPAGQSAAKPALVRVAAEPTGDSDKTHISGADVPPVLSYPKPSSLAAAVA
jgi:DNA primase